MCVHMCTSARVYTCVGATLYMCAHMCVGTLYVHVCVYVVRVEWSVYMCVHMCESVRYMC